MRLSRPLLSSYTSRRTLASSGSAVAAKLEQDWGAILCLVENSGKEIRLRAQHGGCLGNGGNGLQEGGLGNGSFGHGSS